MTWETTPAAPSDDVMLPRDLEDLARQYPRENASMGERASWLLRKASVYMRLSMTLPGESAVEALQEATSARAAGLALQEAMYVEMRDRLRLDVELGSDESADAAGEVVRLSVCDEESKEVAV